MTKNYYLLALLIAAGLAAAGCVTINIYFPAAAAEKVADKIIEEVWQTEEGGGKNGQPDSDANNKTGSKTNKAKP